MVHSDSFPFPNWHRTLLQVLRLPFWFACFWAVVGVAWRPPLASVGLVALCLLLCIAFEWVSRRGAMKKLGVRMLPKRESAEPMDEAVRQQIIRSTTPEGLERIEGTFWTAFSEDVLTATVHIPFCPPLDRIPNVQVFLVDDVDAQLRITSQKRFGVRVDVKRGDMKIDRLCFAIVAEG